MTPMEASIARVAPIRDVSTPGKALGHAIRKARVRRGLTQRQLAIATGMERPNVSRLELGEHEPSISVIVRVARALGVRPSRLLRVLDGFV